MAKESGNTPTRTKAPVTFEVALKRFVQYTNTGMHYAAMCANMSLAVFKEHGDLSKAQAFLNAMPKNYVRKTAYLKWLANFSPVTMGEGNVLVKDKSKEAIAKFGKDLENVDLEAAAAENFWDFAPDPENIMWAETDVVKDLRRTLAKYGRDRFIPKADKDVKFLAEATKAIDKIAAHG